MDIGGIAGDAGEVSKSLAAITASIASIQATRAGIAEARDVDREGPRAAESVLEFVEPGGVGDDILGRLIQVVADLLELHSRLFDDHLKLVEATKAGFVQTARVLDLLDAIEARVVRNENVATILADGLGDRLGKKDRKALRKALGSS